MNQQERLLIEEMLLKKHSQQQIATVAQYALTSKTRFDILMDIFFTGDEEVKRRAIWAINACYDERPDWFETHFEGLVNCLHQPKTHDAIDRNISRIFTCVLPVGREWEELLLDKAYKLLTEKETPIATRCSAMCMVLHFAKPYPELLRDLRFIIESNIEHESAAYKSRGKRILQELMVLGI